LVEGIRTGFEPISKSIEAQLGDLAAESASGKIATERRDLWFAFREKRATWIKALSASFAASQKAQGIAPKPPKLPDLSNDEPDFSLVDDATITNEVMSSRLAFLVIDALSFELNDLKARVAELEGVGDLDTDDIVRPERQCRLILEAWREAGLDEEQWRAVQPMLQKPLCELVKKQFHLANEWLIAQGVMPEVDLRGRLRRTADAKPPAVPMPPAAQPPAFDPNATGQYVAQASGGMPGSHGVPGGYGAGGGGFPGAGPGLPAAGGYAAGGAYPGGAAYQAGVSLPAGAGSGALGMGSYGVMPAGGPGVVGGGAMGSPGVGMPGAAFSPGAAGGYGAAAATGFAPAGAVFDETRAATQAGGLARHAVAVQGTQRVLGLMQSFLNERVPGFVQTRAGGVSPGLAAAIQVADAGLQQMVVAAPGGVEPSPQAVIDQVHEAKQTLKKAAKTQVESATIEIVSLMFQHILMEERLPASVRVWFARLQMPVLKTAIGDPDFFAQVQHPARQLIDRMGACVLGFGQAIPVEGVLEKEIKRVVQVVEAYPETGARVFKTVLSDFEKFLKQYFEKDNAATSQKVTLAQQIELKETLSVQFTIELRRMLDKMQVREVIRDFLFHTWAEVLSVAAVRHGPQHETTKRLKQTARDLIWSASAKPTREDRAQAIQALPGLLVRLREGMTIIGVVSDDQEKRIKELSTVFADAFMAKTQRVSSERLDELAEALSGLEDALPEGDVPLDAADLRSFAGIDAAEMEIVESGGSMPQAAVLAWADEVPMGTWFTLDYGGKRDTVQLVWQGQRKQLSLFASNGGRCVLFQRQRFASFLQAGLLLPLEEESLTVRATRDAMAKLEADPARLLN
jgi:hypothetical protein